MRQNVECQKQNSLLKLFICFLVSSIIFYSGVTLAETEAILSFHSDIKVELNGDLKVKETIQVKALGEQIKRGIFRDFPVSTKDLFGFRKKVGFTVLSVTKDGTPEPYVLENIHGGASSSLGKRIRIGQKDVILKSGNYTYVITYTTTDQIGFFKGYDELYWNVTGNGWDFPIYQASSSLRLPNGIKNQDVTLEGYTGAQGSTARMLTTKKNNLDYYFQTTKELNRNEGLTIVATWPKGFLKEPTSYEVWQKWLKYNPSVRFGLIGLLCVFVYYFIVWSLVGRDPRKGIIIPRYQPPDNFSPAEVRYLRRMAFDQKAFTAEILQLAASGHIIIEQKTSDGSTGDSYKLFNNFSSQPLSKIQKDLLEKLFGYQSSVDLSQENYQKIHNAIKSLKKNLSLKFLKTHLNLNKKYFFTGALLSLITVCVSANLESSESLTIIIFFIVWLSGWSLVVMTLLKNALLLWVSVLTQPLNIMSATVSTLCVVPFIFAEVMGIYMLYNGTSLFIVIILLALILLGALFNYLLKVPTIRGRGVMDQIEGFKLYLGVAEQDRLANYKGPEKTVELFEQFLPYALALDVEQEWSEQFSEAIAAVSMPNRKVGEYSPHFYSGRSFSNISTFSSSFNNSFSSAIANSSTPSSSGGSSSGSSFGGSSSGGGSSGGGGGGGGGGGW